VDSGSKLALEVGNFTLERIVLPGILLRELVQILAQFLVFPEQNERDERSGDRQKGKNRSKQFDKGHGFSLGCLILYSDVRTGAGKNLAICFQDKPGSNLFRDKGS
jgi:hypothetical protein